MKSKKVLLETELLKFEDYVRKYYREHFRKASRNRSHAASAKVTYPIGMLFAFGVPAFAVFYGFRFSYAYNVGKIQEVVPMETYQNLLPVIMIAACGLTVLGLLLGVSWGLSKARQLCFEAEALEMGLRNEFNSRKIASLMENLKLTSGRNTVGATQSKETSVGAVGASASAKTADDEIYDEDPLARMMISHDGREDHDDFIR